MLSGMWQLFVCTGFFITQIPDKGFFVIPFWPVNINKLNIFLKLPLVGEGAARTFLAFGKLFLNFNVQCPTVLPIFFIPDPCCFFKIPMGDKMLQRFGTIGKS